MNAGRDAVEIPKTLLHGFLRWERTTPDRLYFTQPWPDGRVTEYTWREVGDQARRMAAYLKTLNLPPKSNIAVLGKNSAHWIIADLAIWMAGHVGVPLYPTLNTEGAAYILEHSEARLLFIGKMDGKTDGWNEIQHAIPNGLPLIGLPMCPRKDIPQWDDLIARHEPLQVVADPDPDELATIVYTSGTTGRPKGVMHSFKSIAAPCRSAEELWVATPEDRMLSYLPLAHIAERAAVEVPSFIFGFQVYFANSLETFQQDLKRARPTIFFSVPRLWTKFYLAINQKLPLRKQKLLFNVPLLGKRVKKKILQELGLDHARVALTGAAPLPAPIVEWYRGLGLELLEVFGMSENCATSHSNRPGHARPGFVGVPVPGVQCRIAENGEIEVKSPGQMMGYYKMPEKTAEEMTADGYFKTGDRGEIHPGGWLKVTGRVKELFKCSKGKYIAPAPIENKLNNHPTVEVVCVTGPGQPQPFALLMLSLDAQAKLNQGTLRRETLAQELRDLLDQVNESVEDHERLDYAVVVKDQWTMENGFLTPTMKVRRNIIEDRYLPRADSWLAARQALIWE
jgi:long-subunit acyl-CoA synthetase (AMP-forming)